MNGSVPIWEAEEIPPESWKGDTGTIYRAQIFWSFSR